MLAGGTTFRFFSFFLRWIISSIVQVQHLGEVFFNLLHGMGHGMI